MRVPGIGHESLSNFLRFARNLLSVLDPGSAVIRKLMICLRLSIPGTRYKNIIAKRFASISLFLCTLVNDVRTLYINRDPKLLDLIASVEAVEKMVAEDLKKAA